MRASRLRLRLRDTDPLRALDALRRGLAIAQDSGNRATKSYLAPILARLEAEHGDPLTALDHLTLAIRNHHDSGNIAIIRIPLAALAANSRSARTPRSSGHHRRFRTRSLHLPRRPRDHRRDHPPPRGPRRPDLRITRPQGRGDDPRRHRDLRIRPNRPGPSRAERGLGIDDIEGANVSECQVDGQLCQLYVGEPSL